MQAHRIAAHPASVTQDLEHSLVALAPQWLHGCRLRDCWFEPTFHKHVGKPRSGVQPCGKSRYDHERPAPRLLRPRPAIRRLYPDYPLWRDFAYEYEHGKLAIDVINGGPLLREWVDDAAATPQDLDEITMPDEQAWLRTFCHTCAIIESRQCARASFDFSSQEF